MASIGHVAVGMAAARWESWHCEARREVPISSSLWVSMLLYSGLSLLPDLDVIGFRFGVPYEAAWGHRGATHSLCFALITSLLVALVAAARGRAFLRTWLLVALVIGSHGLLDTLTDGGLGAALWWPFSHERVFAPLTPLPVAPIGRRLLSRHGVRVMVGEIMWFLPFLVYACLPRAERGADREAKP